MNTADNAFIRYYKGAYGPTIRISVNSAEVLACLSRVFRGLAGAIGSLSLKATLNVPMSGIDDVTLVSIENPSERLPVHGGVVLLGDGDARRRFRWENPRDDWEWCADKTEALLRAGGPSHQYLTAEGVGDATVELAFREDVHR